MPAPYPIVLIVLGVLVAAIVSAALGAILVVLGIVWLLFDIVPRGRAGGGRPMHR